MIDLNSFLNDVAPSDDDTGFGLGGRRTRISREELADRLKHYEDLHDDFVATDEHLEALVSIFHDHNNLFLTGGAGTGKTTFIKQVVIPELDYRNLHWSVTATTGIAGSHLDGKTINSFFGIGLGPKWTRLYPREIKEFLETAEIGARAPHPVDMNDDELKCWYAYLFDLWHNKSNVKAHIRQGVIKRLRSHEVLLIDEISMCGGDTMLGFLDYMLKILRDDDRPFGGLQLIMIGDFAQLPPVDDSQHTGVPSRSDWAFLSRAWISARVSAQELTRVFRQGDREFIKFLNDIRDGKPVDKDYVARFVRNDMSMEETKNYTFLVPTNKQAKALNVNALQHYPDPTVPLEAEYVIEPDFQKMAHWEARKISDVKAALDKALRLLEKTTFVRVGYPVMFTVNDSGGRFVNGTRGFVREININRRTKEDPYDTDNIVVGIPNYDDPEGEESLVTLRRHNFSRNRDQDPYDTIPAPPEVTERTGLPDLPVYPVIRQFPLIPATAITIHKSQGMSMDTGILALARSFAPGQVYVGLSRLTSPRGMVLTEAEFEAQSDPLVLHYYRAIREGGAAEA